MTEDPAAAAAFYPKVVSWHAQPYPADPSYTLFAATSGPAAGMMHMQDSARLMGARPNWMPYMGADNVDATAAAAEKLGGKVLRPAKDIENIGRFAILADPQGAAFAIYKPSQPGSGGKGEPKPGEYSWEELATDDNEAAFTFYHELFGWEAIHRMDMGPGGTYLIFGTDGVQRGGIYKRSAGTSSPYWLSYVTVADADAAAAAAVAAGGRITTGPMDVPGGGRIAQLHDPSGVLFAVYALPKAAPAKQPAAKKAVAKTAPAKAAAAPPAKAAAAPPASPAPAKTKTGAASPPDDKIASGKVAAKKGTSGKAAAKSPSNASKSAAKPAAKKPAVKPAAKAPAKKRTAAAAKRSSASAKKTVGKAARSMAASKSAKKRPGKKRPAGKGVAKKSVAKKSGRAAARRKK